MTAAPKTHPAAGRPAARAPPAARAEAATPRAIGDLARELGITTRAIRFYETQGLIHPERRGSTRLFSPDDRRRLQAILRARNLGLSLGEIGEHLALLDGIAAGRVTAADAIRRADQLIRLLAAKQRDLGATLKELRRLRSELAASLERPAAEG